MTNGPGRCIEYTEYVLQHPECACVPYTHPQAPSSAHHPPQVPCQGQTTVWSCQCLTSPGTALRPLCAPHHSHCAGTARHALADGSASTCRDMITGATGQVWGLHSCMHSCGGCATCHVAPMLCRSSAPHYCVNSGMWQCNNLQALGTGSSRRQAGSEGRSWYTAYRQARYLGQPLYSHSTACTYA